MSEIWLIVGIMAALLGGAIELLSGDFINYKKIKISKKVLGFLIVLVGVIAVVKSYQIELKETQSIAKNAIDASSLAVSAKEKSEEIQRNIRLLKQEISWKKFDVNKNVLNKICDYKLYINNDANQESVHYPRFNISLNIFTVSLSDHFDMVYKIETASVQYIATSENAKLSLHLLSERVEEIYYRCINSSV
jgi:hypothetical protein